MKRFEEKSNRRKPPICDGSVAGAVKEDIRCSCLPVDGTQFCATNRYASKLKRIRAKGTSFEKHMAEHEKHPNAFALRQMEWRLFSGVALTDRYLAQTYREIFFYLAQDVSRLHPCLRSMQLVERLSPENIVEEAWLTLESDGTTDRAPEGDRYRLSLGEVQNLWLLVYPDNQ